MTIRRFTVIILAMLLCTTMFTGCGKAKSDKISVVCTIFPQYDWVREILGDKAADMDLTLILNSRTDLHNYQPSVDDIIKISSCDLFIYVGGESDKWVKDALKESKNPSMIVINLLDTLGDSAKIEEIIDGMEESQDENENEEDIEYDEHVWLSLKNTQVFCPVIADALSSLDSGNSKIYKDNETAYIEKLKSLGWKVIVVWECEIKKAFRTERLGRLYNEITDIHT